MAGRGTGDSAGKEKLTVDQVKLQAIHRETIAKEKRHQKLYTEFNINPFHKVNAVAGKIMSWHDNLDATIDEGFLKIIHEAALEPPKKYTEPQSTSQEIGWYSSPLIDRDATDRRLNFHRYRTEITEYMECAWRQKEQTVNLQ